MNNWNGKGRVGKREKATNVCEALRLCRACARGNGLGLAKSLAELPDRLNHLNQHLVNLGPTNTQRAQQLNVEHSERGLLFRVSHIVFLAHSALILLSPAYSALTAQT